MDSANKTQAEKAMSNEQPDGRRPDHGDGPSNEQQRAAARAADAAAAHTPLPEVTFSTFVMSLASSALVHLGEVPEPESGRTMANLPVAKHTIDILAMPGKNRQLPCARRAQAAGRPALRTAHAIRHEDEVRLWR
jgi:hypothetical protein